MKNGFYQIKYHNYNFLHSNQMNLPIPENQAELIAAYCHW